MTQESTASESVATVAEKQPEKKKFSYDLTLTQKGAFGIGAIGKDLVYALSANYIMYYYN